MLSNNLHAFQNIDHFIIWSANLSDHGHQQVAMTQHSCIGSEQIICNNTDGSLRISSDMHAWSAIGTVDFLMK